MSWDLLLADLWRLALAFVLALPVAWDRERRERSAGLRTFPLVAVASCCYALIGRGLADRSPEAEARVLQGLIAGIGFIGGGAILKSSVRTHGTATASSLWSTGALGAAVAVDRLELAVLLAAVNFAVFRWLTPLKGVEEREAPEPAGEDE